LTRRQPTPAEARLLGRVASVLPNAAGIRLNDNARQWVSLRRDRATGRPKVSVHRALALAPPDVEAALLRFLQKSGQADRRLLQDYMTRHVAEGGIDTAPRPRDVRPEPRGRHHDLQPMADRVNAAHFGGALEFEIGWGKLAVPRRAQRSIRLGSCSVLHKQIRIHPVLDDERVPAFFVEFVVHHELCHLAAPPVERGPGARRSIHHAEFKRLERLHPRHADAIAWERAHIARFMRPTRLDKFKRMIQGARRSPAPPPRPEPPDDDNPQLSLF
jgi:predicted SprT family Zn-dependent metalloprotease